MTNAPIQQGDILLVPTTRAVVGPFLPRTAAGWLVFATGKTGHVHALGSTDPGEAVVDPSTGGFLLLVPEGGTVLRHLDADGAATQDHAAVSVPAGLWEVRIQREVRWGESSVVED